MPKIKLSLSLRSIQSAIEEVKSYQKKVNALDEKLVKRLTEYGVEEAKNYALYMNAYDSGELVNGIIAEYREGKGYIVSTSPHSAFVEMGTGIRGKQDPNPYNYLPGWTYDVNEHGEDGWFYVGKDGKRHWTKGMPHRPYMYETAQALKKSAAWVAEKELKEGG